MAKKLVSILILGCFFITSILGSNPVYAQDFRLPAPGVMVRLSPPLDPPILKGIKVHTVNPFRFDFILDKGDSELSNDQLKDESSKLIKYFLASLTIPEKDLWVNLSPYEKDRIIPKSFGLTEMGRDLLAEDYMLKQITASLIYPEDAVGKKFWKRIYEEAAKRYGTTNIPVNTFNKVWIVPEKAVVYENAKAGTAYVVESKLKVMLEQDYLSLQKHEGIQSGQAQTKDTSQLGSQIVREIVIPELTTEVNENKNFARLRQVYNSLILATWYKKKIKDSILSQVYTDRNKVAGVNIDDPQEKERIYQQYLKAFKKGVYNYIKEEPDLITNQLVPRKYFSGGFGFSNINSAMITTNKARSIKNFVIGTAVVLGVTIAAWKYQHSPVDDLALKLQNAPQMEKENLLSTLLTNRLENYPRAKIIVEEALKKEAIEVLADLQKSFHLNDLELVSIKGRIQELRFVYGLGVGDGDANSLFEISKQTDLNHLRIILAHEIGHNILKMKCMQAGISEWEVPGNISEFFAELVANTYQPHPSDKRGTADNQWAYAQIEAINKTLIENGMKFNDIEFNKSQYYGAFAQFVLQQILKGSSAKEIVSAVYKQSVYIQEIMPKKIEGVEEPIYVPDRAMLSGAKEKEKLVELFKDVEEYLGIRVKPEIRKKVSDLKNKINELSDQEAWFLGFSRTMNQHSVHLAGIAMEVARGEGSSEEEIETDLITCAKSLDEVKYKISRLRDQNILTDTTETTFFDESHSNFENNIIEAGNQVFYSFINSKENSAAIESSINEWFNKWIPLRKDPKRFTEYLESRYPPISSDRSSLEFRQQAHQEFARIGNVVPGQILFASKNDYLLLGLFGADMLKPNEAGNFIRIRINSSEALNLILIQNSLDDFGFLKVLAHEVAHLTAAPIGAEFSRVMIEGFQVFREYEILDSIRKSNTEFGRKTDALINNYASRLKVRFLRSLTKVLFKLTRRNSLLNFKDNLRSLIVTHSGYYRETDFVEDMIRVAGYQSVESFYYGDVTLLRNALGHDKFDVIRGIFDDMHRQRLTRDPILKEGVIFKFARAFFNIDFQRNKYKNASSETKSKVKDFTDNLGTTLWNTRSFLNIFQVNQLIKLFSRYLSDEINRSQFINALHDLYDLAMTSSIGKIADDGQLAKVEDRAMNTDMSRKRFLRILGTLTAGSTIDPKLVIKATAGTLNVAEKTEVLSKYITPERLRFITSWLSTLDEARHTIGFSSAPQDKLNSVYDLPNSFSYTDFSANVLSRLLYSAGEYFQKDPNFKVMTNAEELDQFANYLQTLVDRIPSALTDQNVEHLLNDPWIKEYMAPISGHRGEFTFAGIAHHEPPTQNEWLLVARRGLENSIYILRFEIEKFHHNLSNDPNNFISSLQDYPNLVKTVSSHFPDASWDIGLQRLMDEGPAFLSDDRWLSARELFFKLNRSNAIFPQGVIPTDIEQAVIDYGKILKGEYPMPTLQEMASVQKKLHRFLYESEEYYGITRDELNQYVKEFQKRLDEEEKFDQRALNRWENDGGSLGSDRSTDEAMVSKETQEHWIKTFQLGEDKLFSAHEIDFKQKSFRYKPITPQNQLNRNGLKTRRFVLSTYGALTEKDDLVYSNIPELGLVALAREGDFVVLEKLEGVEAAILSSKHMYCMGCLIKAKKADKQILAFAHINPDGDHWNDGYKQYQGVLKFLKDQGYTNVHIGVMFNDKEFEGFPKEVREDQIVKEAKDLGFEAYKIEDKYTLASDTSSDIILTSEKAIMQMIDFEGLPTIRIGLTNLEEKTVSWGDFEFFNKAMMAKENEENGDNSQLANAKPAIMKTSNQRELTPGGIDLTPANMNLQTQNAGEEIKFHLDPAMLQQLQNAPGFVPVIINIQPLKSLSDFLGLNKEPV